MAKAKRHLTRQEEFDILKLILDKFLWLGIFLMAYGFYLIIDPGSYAIKTGFTVMLGGAALLYLFMNVLMSHYYFMKE